MTANMPLLFSRRTSFAFVAWAAFFALAVSSNESFANIGQEYGFGPRTAGLAGAGSAAWGFGAFAAYNNPAGLPFAGDKRLLIQLGVIDMNPSFLDINNVVVENNFTSDKSPPRTGGVDNNYRSTLGEELGLVYRMFPELANLTVGIAAFVPLQQLAYMDTGETFVPEYMLYRARTQRPQVETGLGIDVTPRLHFGVGLHLAFSLTSSATVFLQTDAAKPSTMRFSSSLKPKVAPQFGALYTSETATSDGQPRFTAGAVVRAPVASDNNLFLNSGARAFGSFAALDFDFSAISSLFYDPLTVELGTMIAETDHTRTFLQFEFQGWSKYQAPAIAIQTPTLDNCSSSSGTCGLSISGGKNPSFNFRNIIVPRVGQEYSWGRLTLRAGYAYRQGIIDDGGVGTPGAGNYLDPSKHIFTVGAGYHFLHFLNFEVPCDVDFNLAYQALITEHVTKAPGDETGAGTGNLKIGAPGYDAGGSVYGGGLSLSLAF